MCGGTRSTFDCAAVAAVALTVMWARQVVCDASTEAQQFCKSKGIPSVGPALALFTVRTFVSCRVCAMMLLTTTLTIVGVQLLLHAAGDGRVSVPRRRVVPAAL